MCSSVSRAVCLLVCSRALCVCSPVRARYVFGRLFASVIVVIVVIVACVRAVVVVACVCLSVRECHRCYCCCLCA